MRFGGQRESFDFVKFGIVEVELIQESTLLENYSKKVFSFFFY
jgi:hypothetical protein